MFGIKTVTANMLLQEGWENGGGGGSGKGGRDVQNDQKIAFNFGIDPSTLSDEDYNGLLKLLGISQTTGIDPQQLLTIKELQDAGFVTPSTIQKLLGIGESGGASGGGSSGTSYPPASADPRYWEFQERELDQQLMQMGFTNENMRRQLVAQLIANRNNTAVDVAATSANVAKTAAEFAANPRDAVAELMYRNQVGGSTPFGDLTNDNFGAYGKALAEKAASIFSPVNQDIQQARVYRDSIPPVEIVTPPGAGAGMPATAPAPVNGLQALMDRLNGMNDQDKEAFRKWTTATAPAPMARGGKINFDDIYDSRSKDGFSPSSSEGGTSLNLHERAIVVGESGQVYATLGERRPDGTVRAEQLQIKPLKSEVEKDKKLAERNKAVVETQKQTMSAFASGGTVNSMPDDFMEQLRQLLGSYGGAGGGTGQVNTPLQSPRLLAGAPWESLMDDPAAMDYALSGYSALGIDPRTLQATVKKFSPTGVQNNFPRVAFA